MKIAYTISPGRGDTDLALLHLAERLLADGMNVAGTVQINSERGDDHPCDMDVKVLPAGPVIRISQDLGAGSRGCRLDPSALEAAVAQVGAALTRNTDLLIINKFGKHEAEGRGFRDVIAEALALEIPVLIGVNKLNLTAFMDFVDGMAVAVAPDLDALTAWARHRAIAGEP